MTEVKKRICVDLLRAQSWSADFSYFSGIRRRRPEYHIFQKKMCIIAKVDYHLCSHRATYIYDCMAATIGPQGALPCHDIKWPMSRSCHATHCSEQCCTLAERQIRMKIAENEQIISARPPEDAVMDRVAKFFEYRLRLSLLDMRLRLSEELQRARSYCAQKCRIDSFRAYAVTHQNEPGIDDVINAGNTFPVASYPRRVAWLITSFEGPVVRQHPYWPRINDRLHGRC
jgi:hypothetical protein